MKSKPLAIVTGATAGIGFATAKLLTSEGYDLILTGRRRERLDKISKSLSSRSTKVHSLVFDVSKRSEIKSAFRDLEPLLKRVTVLVNNAGLAVGTDLVDTADLNHWDQMIDTNVKGLLYMTRLVLPYMKKRNHGHIVNLGSAAGRWVYKGGAVYCATKFAVRAISEGIRMDLIGTQIRVSNIEPGMVETEFSEIRFGDKEKAKAVYANMKPLTDKDIAESIVWCIQRPAHVNIQEMVIFPVDQPAVGQVYRHV